MSLGLLPKIAFCASLNDALRLVIGCLRPTSTDNLFVLSSITPTELHRKRATLSLACRVKEPGHLLSSLIDTP